MPKVARNTLILAFLLCSHEAHAQLSNAGILDQTIERFNQSASTWAEIIQNHATFLFYTLGVISLSFTFGMMLLRRADIGEFFAEFIRFILFFGFFLWLLRNGPKFSTEIVSSLASIGSQASGTGAASPSSIVDFGFLLISQSFKNSSIWSAFDSSVGFVLSLLILIMLSVIAINLSLLFITSWILSYAGIFFLGFGGSRWTSDMAINYYKTVLGNAVQIMTMVLIIGVGNDLLEDFYNSMSENKTNFEELCVFAVFTMALMFIANKVPPLVAGIMTGSSLSNIGNFSAASAVVGAAKVAATTTFAAAGGVSTVIAAAKSGVSNVDEGTDVLSSFGKGKGGPEGSSNGSAGVSMGSTAPSSFGNSSGTGTGGKGISRATKVAIDAGANLASTAWSSAKQAAGNRIDRTIGGKMAQSINEKSQSGSDVSSEGGSEGSSRNTSFQGLVQPINTLSGSKPEPIDAEAEAAAFINKNT